MTTLEQHQTTKGPETKVHVAVEQGVGTGQPAKFVKNKEEKSESKEDEGVSSLKQILASIAESTKYLPQQVNTFLDSMEGKTLDDLRVEAMHLANKAQEEAKKKAEDVTSMGRSTVDNAKQKVQDVTDMAKNRTADIAQKGLDMVQPQIQATKDATMSLANRATQTTTSYATRGLDMLQSNLKPYAMRAKEYLPEPAKEFVKENLENKSLNEIGQAAITVTRKKLLSVEKETAPTTKELALEVKDAALSGKLVKNILTLSEQAASRMFGESPKQPNAGSLRRVYNLSSKVTYGVLDVANKQMNMARQKMMDTANPYLDSLAKTPIVPSWMMRWLRSSTAAIPTGSNLQQQSTTKSESQQQVTAKTTGEKATKVSVNVDVSKADAPAGSTTARDIPTTSTTTTTGAGVYESSKIGGPGTIGNTNAQGLGEKGEKGMGITTTGGEKPEDVTEHASSKKKHHNKL
jgi:hypothetical protein